eukprot:Skav236776  [mRNA]  locus=scaffold1361:94490:105171:+ [translate_table: standard]
MARSKRPSCLPAVGVSLAIVVLCRHPGSTNVPRAFEAGMAGSFKWPNSFLPKVGQKIQRPDGHSEHHEESIFEEFVDEVKLCPWLLFAEISLVVLLSALFEQLQHWVREHLDHSGDKEKEEMSSG